MEPSRGSSPRHGQRSERPQAVVAAPVTPLEGVYSGTDDPSSPASGTVSPDGRAAPYGHRFRAPAKLELLCPLAAYSINGLPLPLQPVLRVVDTSGAVLLWDQVVIAKFFLEADGKAADGKLQLVAKPELFAAGSTAEPNEIGLICFCGLAFIGQPFCRYSVIFSSADCESLIVSGIQAQPPRAADAQVERVPEIAGSFVAPQATEAAAAQPPEPITRKQANTLGSFAFRGHPSHEVMRAMQEGIIHAVRGDSSPLVPHIPLAAKEFRKEVVTRSYRRSHTTALGGSAVSSVVVGSRSDDCARFQFTDYSPTCFKYIRALFGISSEQYLEVMSEVWTTVTTPGKSKALLYFAGREFVIKTMKSSESKFLRSILLKYYMHVQANTGTLVARFYGHHRLTALWGPKAKIDFIVMNNVLRTARPIHMRFDLKGSTYKRAASAAERAKKSCIYKDNDIAEMQRRIHVGKKWRTVLVQQLRADVSFLQDCKIMDYSLLLGIHFVDGSDDTAKPGDDGGIRSDSLPEIYYFGVIDILQKFDSRKKIENRWRRWRTKQPHAISAVPAEEYGERFLAFMSKHIV